MFEKATKLKLRFKTDRGYITVEDLWDLPLTSISNCSLDAVAKDLNRAIKDSAEESFVTLKNEADTILELKFAIVKHIISVRLAERETRKNQVMAKEQKEKILSILAEKENDSLKNKTPEELKAMLEKL